MKSVLRALLHTSAALAASASLSTLAGQTRTSDVVIAGYGSATYKQRWSKDSPTTSRRR